MHRKFREIVEELDHEDLVKLNTDISEGTGEYMRQILQDKIREIEEAEQRICAVWGNEINPYYVNDFALHFGPRDFKKRAHFCALDCLEYFTAQLKRINKKKLARPSSRRKEREEFE